MSGNQGWIKLYRSVQNNWIWEDRPFNRQTAWIDLLLMANHEDKDVLIGNKLITVKAGQRWTSVKKLADRWGWSRHKTKDFLDLLQSDNMIYVHTTPQGTMVSIVNYLKFQGGDGNGGHQKDNDGTSRGHQKDNDGTQTRMKRMTKNDKEGKEEAAAPLVHVPGQSYNMGLDYDPWGTKK